MRRLKFYSSFFLWFSISVLLASVASGEPSLTPDNQLSLFGNTPEELNQSVALVKALKGYSDRFSFGVILGQEYRLVEETSTEEVNGKLITKKHLTARSRGIITVGALKYQVKDYMRLFVSYGYSHREFLDGSQVAALGLEYTGLLVGETYAGATLGLGCDVDHSITMYNCFGMIGVVIGGDVLDF